MTDPSISANSTSDTANLNATADREDGRPYSLRVFHRVAWLLTSLVFPLIWVGGLVTTTDAGMAVPDWPGTYGYNMFAYPLSAWYYGPLDLFLEHGHRLHASLAGMVCVGLTVVAFYQPSKKIRVLTVLALLLIILQGVLGGIRVEFSERAIALVHGTVGPAFFSLVVFLVVMSSRWWHEVDSAEWWGCDSKLPLTSEQSQHLGHIWEQLWTARSVAAVTVVLAFCQLFIGANVRHLPDMPMTTPDQFRVVVWFHILMALSVVAGVVLLVTRPVGPVPGLQRSRWFLLTLVALQMGLGLGTWIVKFGWPEWFDGYLVAEQFRIQEKNYGQVHMVTAHVAVGSLILATSVWSATRLWRAEYCAGELLGKRGSNEWRDLSKRHLPLYHAG